MRSLHRRLLPLLILSASALARPAWSDPPAEPSRAEAVVEAARLSLAFQREVPVRLRHSAANDALWISRLRTALAAAQVPIERPQLAVVVDRNPHVQQLRIVMIAPDGGPGWRVIGASKVSTGQPNRRLYYITPIGVFLHTDAILDYRAEGTFNENHIRGLGLRGMRVWDFGWHSARKGWLATGERGDIRLLMHATDPQFLEQRLGRPASEGCVRIPGAVNRFLDVHGVLDADYERTAQKDPRYRALLNPEREPTELAGTAMVVVDSSEAAEIPRDPPSGAAKRIAAGPRSAGAPSALVQR